MPYPAATLAATDSATPTQGGATIFGGASAMTCRRAYEVPSTADFTSVRLYFPNWWMGSAAGDAPATNTVDTKAAIEYGGNVYPVEFSGLRAATIATGDTLESDVVAGLTLTAGSTYHVRTYVDVGSPSNLVPTAMIYGDSFTLSTDLVDSTGALANSAAGTTLWMPSAITGEPDVPVKQVVVWGDSISTEADNWFRRALADDFAVLALACGGEAALGFVQPTHREYRTEFSTREANFFENYGVNDLGQGGPSPPTAIEVQDVKIELWNLALSLGALTVFTITINPRTDGDFSTANGQTIPLPLCEPNRLDHNEWLRDGAPIDADTGLQAPTGTVGALRTALVQWNGSSHVVTGSQDTGHPLTAIFDIAQRVTTTNTGGDEVWIANTTADGVHPTDAGFILQAPVVKTDLLTVPSEAPTLPKLVKLDGVLTLLP